MDQLLRKVLETFRGAEGAPPDATPVVVTQAGDPGTQGNVAVVSSLATTPTTTDATTGTAAADAPTIATTQAPGTQQDTQLSDDIKKLQDDLHAILAKSQV